MHLNQIFSVCMAIQNRVCMNQPPLKTGSTKIRLFLCASSILPPWGSRLYDPGSNKKRGVGKILLSCLCRSHKFHKIDNYFIFERYKKIWPIDNEFSIFNHKSVIRSQNMGLGSGIQGSQKLWIPDRQHFLEHKNALYLSSVESSSAPVGGHTSLHLLLSSIFP